MLSTQKLSYHCKNYLRSIPITKFAPQRVPKRGYTYYDYRENRVWLENMVKPKKDRSDRKRPSRYYDMHGYRSKDELDLFLANDWFDPRGVNAKSLAPESRLPINYFNDFPNK